MNRFCLTLAACLSCLAIAAAAEPASKPTKKAEKKVPVKKPIVVKVKANAVQVILLGESRNRIGGTIQVRKKVDPKDNVERFLLLAPKGPIVVEATLTLDDQPFRVAREKLVDKLMKAADTDGDGKATWKEAMANPRFFYGNAGRFMFQRVLVQPKKKEKKKDEKDATKQAKPNAVKPEAKAETKKEAEKPKKKVQAVRRIAVGGQQAAQRQRESYTKQFDANKDGVVDRGEARRFLASTTGGAAFAVTRVVNRSRQPDVKTVLDTDKDGKLSKAELQAAEQRLKSRDANDNDLLEASELGGNARFGNRGGFQIRVIGGVGAVQTGRSQIGFLLGPGAALGPVFKALIEKYGGENGEIRADSFPLFPKLVEQLDANKNGRLDSDEIKGFNRVPAHVVLQVNLGNSKQAGLVVKSLAPELGNKQAIQAKFAEKAILQVPGVKIHFAAAGTLGGIRVQVNFGRAAQSQLERYDTNKNGYIEKKELKGKNAYVLRQFDQWDADSDGKVFAKEIEADYQRQRAPSQTRVAAGVSERGPSLFAALDVSGDNRLSLREMKTAGTRLLDFDKNKDGQIDMDELPTEIDVAFNRGNRFGTRFVLTAFGRAGGRTQQPAPKKGPEWFQRMDRNGDGDVTLREFLGTSEQFKKIDTNSDGFIEPKEADAAKLPTPKKQ